MRGDATQLAYLCLDRGIPIDGTKGASVHLRSMGRALQRDGFDLHAVVARREADRDVGFPVTVLPRPPKGGGLSRELVMLAHGRELIERLAGMPDPDAVYERFALFSPAGLALARERGVPFVVEVNAPLWIEAARYRSLHLTETARALSLDVLRRADHVLVVSEGLRRTLEGEGVAADRIHLFPNGVDLGSFGVIEPVARPASLRDRKVILFCGSLKPWHGVEFLLEAFQQAAARRPLGLWIVGSGPLDEAVAAAARDLPGAIVAQGAVPHHSIPSYLAAADVAVAPYPAEAPDYFCPLKVIEALAARCPLVASRVPCVTDLLGEDAPAVLFTPGDPQAFAAALDAILDDPIRTERRSEVGQALVARRFTWKARVAELRSILAGAPDETSRAAVREVGT